MTNYKPGEISSFLFSDSTDKPSSFIPKQDAPKTSNVVFAKPFAQVVESKRPEDTEDKEDDKQSEDEGKDKKRSPEEIKSRTDRTLFVGNIPFNKEVRNLTKKLEAFFKELDVESIRLRGLPIIDTKQPRRAAIYHQKFSDLKKNLIAYVTLKSQDTMEKALQWNRMIFEGNHLIIDTAEPKELTKSDCRKSVFIGNVAFDTEEEEIYKAFDKKKLPAQKVRLVRDKVSSMGKGFGFVTFENQEAAKKAVSLKDKIKVHDRYLRITHANYNIDKKQEKKQLVVQKVQREIKAAEAKKDQPWQVVNSISNEPEASGPKKAGVVKKVDPKTLPGYDKYWYNKAETANGGYKKKTFPMSEGDFKKPYGDKKPYSKPQGGDYNKRSFDKVEKTDYFNKKKKY
jgi:RNA recognition motif-containing protein